MTDKFLLNVTTQYTTESSRWLRAIARGDNVSVVFFPKTDRFIRIGQFLQDKALFRTILKKNDRYIFQRIDFDPRDVETMEDLHYQIREQLNFARITKEQLSFEQWIAYLKEYSVTLVLVIADAEKFLNEEEKSDLSLLTQLIDSYSPVIRTLCFFETDITHPSLSRFLPSSPRIYETICKYPLYDHDETISFIRLFARQWGYITTGKQEEEITRACGGHLWFVKEAVRELVENKKSSFLEEGMMFRLRSVYELLIPAERDVLQKSVMNKKISTPEEKHSESFLRSMRVLDSQNNSLIGFYKDWIMQRNQEVGKLMLQNDRITLNDIPLDKFFSRQEDRVMKLFLRCPNQVLPRDEVAKYIWPTNTTEHYSDWAIDQLISRLRKRLEEFSLPTTMIQSVRGKGYLLTLT